MYRVSNIYNRVCIDIHDTRSFRVSCTKLWYRRYAAYIQNIRVYTKPSKEINTQKELTLKVRIFSKNSKKHLVERGESYQMIFSNKGLPDLVIKI